MRRRLSFLRHLTWQMAAGVIAISAGTALLMAYLVNVATWSHFENYVRHNLQSRTDGMARTLATTYRQNQGWNQDVIVGLTHWTMMEDLEAQLLDAKGEVIWDSAAAEHNMDFLPMPGYAPNHPQESLPYRMQSPVVVGGRTVATLVVRASGVGGVFSQHDVEFRQTVNRWLLVAVGVVAAIALLFSLVLAESLTRPLLELNRLAQKMRLGDWHLRVKPSGAAEVSELAESLNSLAEALERQEQLRRQLTADVAHELRTPLANLRSHLQALIDGLWEPTQARLQSFLEEVLRLVDLVGDLQRLTEAEAPTMDLELEAVPLANAAEQTVDFFSALALEKDLALAFRGSEAENGGPPLCVIADRPRLKQILANLVANAIKYTPPGGKIELQVVDGAERRKEAGITVSDTGPGIPPDQLPLIFERFYRGERSRSRATGGAGLGLSIAQALVRAMNGRLEVASRVGQGSVFTVWLPLATAGVECDTDEDPAGLDGTWPDAPREG